ncbi:MAG: hypothetical protein GY701_30920, partial [Sulfitobacter sp.]|nr:hypothetical protein [Sulfitobacter sp.]
MGNGSIHYENPQISLNEGGGFFEKNEFSVRHYLGDDEGVAKATVSTVVTVLGYILFMGALIAILVQWLSDTMDRLELGLTPV